MAIAALLLAPRVASAQPLTSLTITDEPSPIYPGQRFDFAIYIRALIGFEYARTTVDLPAHYRLRQVYAVHVNDCASFPCPAGAPRIDFITEGQLDDEPLGTGIGCTEVGNQYEGCSVAPAVGATTYTVTLLRTAGQQQVVVDLEPPSVNWEHIVHFTVEVLPTYTCAPQAQATFEHPPDSPVVDSAACAAQVATVLDVHGVPPTLTTERAAGGQVLPWTWEAVTDLAGTVPITWSLPFTCQPASACLEGDPAQRLRIAAPVPEVEVLNQPVDPPPGTFAVAIDTVFGGVPFADAVAIAIEERPPAVFRVVESLGRTTIATDESATFDLVEATNALGGEEPRRVGQWQVEVLDPLPLPPGLDPNTWLVNPGLATTDLLIPQADVTFLGGATMQVRITAVPATPGGAAAQNAVVIDVTSEPPAPRRVCSIEATSQPLGLGETTSLALRVQVASDPPTAAAIPVQWSASRGTVTPGATDSGLASYRAPFTEGEVTVTAEFDAPALCDNTRSARVLRVEGGLRVVLRGPTARLRATEVFPLALELLARGGEALDDLTLSVQTTGLNVIGDAPRRVEGPLEFGSAATAAPNSRGWAFQVQGDGTSSAQILAQVRAGVSCGKTTAQLVVRQGTVVVAQSGRVVMQTQCDAELTESTLFGKVFVDRDEDGVQQAGEPGLPKVMVALSASVYAVTDAFGRYHIPRLQAGRVAVKVNPHTLPVGAEVLGAPTRAMTLTPGLFTRVNFPVRTLSFSEETPLHFRAAGSGVRLGDSGPTYRARFTAAPGELSATVNGKSVASARDADGVWTLDLPIEGERSTYLLVHRDDRGRLHAYAFGVHVYDRGEERLVLPWGPRALARWAVPADGLVPPGGLRLRGAVQGPGKVQAEFRATPTACESTTNEPGATEFDCVLPVQGEKADLVLALDAAADDRGDDPPPLELVVPLEVEQSQHFLVGIAGGGMGCDPVPNGFSLRTCLGDGAGAFFYQGRVGELQITAGADLAARDRQRSLRGWRSGDAVMDTLLGSDPTRVFRDLDPESYYPTYGDGSTVVDERESGGRFFFRLQHGDDYFRWGGVRTGGDDVEVGTYERALYGAAGRFTLGEPMAASPDPGLSITAFGARPQTAAATDELSVTGGSLYFLSHRPVVEGSAQVVLEVLDEVSELPVRRVVLSEGSDFELDVAGGRLTLDPALPSGFLGRSLTSRGGAGPTTRLLVSYEYVPSLDPAEGLTLGGRARGHWGPVELGGGYATELGDGVGGIAPTYHLAGGSLRLDLGEWVRAEIDYAYSQGTSRTVNRSRDGGLSVLPVTPVGDDEGHAFAAEIGTQLGGVDARVYGRWIQPGFADTRHVPGRERRQGGAVFAMSFESDTAVWAQLDTRAERATGAPWVLRNTGLAGVSQKVWRVDLGLEGRYIGEGSPNFATQTHRALLAAQVGYHVFDELTLSVRRAQELTGVFEGETALGMHYASTDRWTLGAEIGLEDSLDVFGRVQGGLPLDESTDLYVGYVRASRIGQGLSFSGDEPSHRWVTGGRRTTSGGAVLYAESGWEQQPDRPAGQVGTHVVGGEVPLSGAMRLSVNYERGALVGALGETLGETVRDAGSLGVSWASEIVSLRASVDARVEHDRYWQLGAQGRTEVRPFDALTLALALRGASSMPFANAPEENDRAAWEGSVGFALRPVETDWVNAFGRYALVQEREWATQGFEQWSHIGALATVFEIWGPFAAATKVAYRYSEVFLEDGGRSDDDALVGALRLDLHLNAMWDVTVEGRMCGSPIGGGELRGGALLELGALFWGWLRLGAGYNFSDISATSVRCEEPGARGLFMRAEAIY